MNSFALAVKSLEALKAHRLQATPQNYTVWYIYSENSFPPLNQDIDTLSSTNGCITDADMAVLHHRYFGGETMQQAIDATAETTAILDTMGGELRAMESGTDAYATTLSDAMSNAHRDPKGVIRNLLAATGEVQDQNKRLQDRLRASQQEIDALKHSLEDTRKRAETDMLTGLANRPAFDRHLAQTRESGLLDDGTLCLVMIDIDHFKRFNDSFGHQTGDQVLRLVGRMIADHVPAGSLGARYGGEEFAMVLHDMALPQAVAIADQIRVAVAARKLVHKATKQDLGSVTLSAGVAAFRDGLSLDAWIESADQALYAAKRAGRNQVLTDFGAGSTAGAAACA